MNKKIIAAVVAVISVAASIWMYRTGHRSSHLSELKNFWWIPLPLAVICLLIAGSPEKKS